MTHFEKHIGQGNKMKPIFILLIGVLLLLIAATADRSYAQQDQEPIPDRPVAETETCNGVADMILMNMTTGEEFSITQMPVLPSATDDFLIYARARGPVGSILFDYDLPTGFGSDIENVAPFTLLLPNDQLADGNYSIKTSSYSDYGLGGELCEEQTFEFSVGATASANNMIQSSVADDSNIDFSSCTVWTPNIGNLPGGNSCNQCVPGHENYNA